MQCIAATIDGSIRDMASGHETRSVTVATLSVLIVVSLLGCRREVEPETHASGTAPAPVARLDAGAAGERAWYRAIVRAADGVEARFVLRVPAPGAPGQSLIKVGDHELGSDATFDGKT